MNKLSILLVLFSSFICFGQNKSLSMKGIDTDLWKDHDKIVLEKNYFKDCHIEGSIVIFDNQKKKWIVSDTVDIHKETLPASTFKVINLLIALETKTIRNANEIVKWPGKTDTVKYGYRPEIYHDMSVKEAFELSAGWVFVELAKKIGKENYKKYLAKSHYGNGDLSQNDADFWNFGAFEISPVNQVVFLKKLNDGKLPFSRKNMKIVQNVMITEKNKNYLIRSKSGWTRDQGMNTGWWIGDIENVNGVYFFATRLLQDRKFNNPDFGKCRKEITNTVLRDLKIIY